MGGPSHSTFRTTYATTQSSQPSSICADTESVPRRPQNRVQVGTGRGLGRKKANARGTSFVTESDSSSSQLPPLSGHKRLYNSASFAAATGGNRRPATGFGVYSNPTTGAQVFNVCLLCFGVYSDSYIMILPYFTLSFLYYSLVHQVRRFYMGQQN